MSIADMNFKFDGFEQCSLYYKRIINALQMNYSIFQTEEFYKLRERTSNNP